MAFVQVPPDSTGNKVETTTDGTTMRQVINIGKNAASGADIAPVDATLGLAVNTLELAAQKLDYDTGAGTATQVILGIALPASGGPVAGGTATNPINTVSVTGTATVSSVAGSASNVTLSASNASRRGLSIYNDSTAILYVKCGATATTSSFTVAVPSSGYFELPAPVYTGIVDGIWASATGAARVTEAS